MVILLPIVGICLGVCLVIARNKKVHPLRIFIASALMLVVLLYGLFIISIDLYLENNLDVAFSGFITVVLFFLIPLSILGRLRSMPLLISWGSLLVIFALVSKIETAIQNYDNSFEVIQADDSVITTYAHKGSAANELPYRKDRPIAKLDEPASLYLEGTLSMDGATALYPVYAAFAQALLHEEDDYPPAGKAEVKCTTTPRAYENLINGGVDMIFVAAPSEEQKAAALRRGRELEFVPIGKDAFVFLVNAKNPFDGLSTKQIQDIYSGEITNWRELGTSDGKAHALNKDIIAFQRDEGSGSQSAFLRFMAGRVPITALTQDVLYDTSDMGDTIEVVADYKNYPAAIGYSFRYFLQEMKTDSRVKLLELDGVYPSVENIRNGSYPQTDYFYAVFDKNSSNPNIHPMLEWILSIQGQELVEKTGYVAINGI